MRSLQIDERAYGPERRDFGLPMPRRHFLFAALLAIGVSAIFHYGVFQFATLPFGIHGDGPPKDETPREVVVLQDENERPLNRETDGSALIPTDPSSVTPESAPIEAPAADFEPAELPSPKPIDIDTTLPGIDTAMVEPAAAPILPTEYEARQELMKIDEEIFSEEVVTVPREFTPDVAREIDAPDIAPPSLPELSSLTPTATPLPPAIAPPLAAPPPLDEIASLPPPSLDDLIPDARLGDALQKPEDLAAAISAASAPRPPKEHKAVEQLLDIKVSQFTTGEDPDYLYFKVAIERSHSAAAGSGGDGLGSVPGLVGQRPALPVMSKGVVLMQDCSLSITQPKLEEFKRGALKWLDTIRPGDYFNVISFSDGVETCFPDLVRMDADKKTTAQWFVRDMGLKGKTDVYASLQKLQKMAAKSPVPVVAVLLTDGRPTIGLKDSTSIIESFTREAGGQLSVFCVGGGSRANEYLLDLLSYRNRGDSILVGAASQLPKAIGTMAGQLERPVLANLRYAFTGQVQPEVYPATLTHLYLDRPLEIFGRVPRSSGKLAFQVVGSSSSRESHDMVFQLDPKTGGQGDAYLRQQWAWHKMYHLIGEYLNDREPSKLAQIRLMASKFNLRVPYISGEAGQLSPVAKPIPR